MESQAYNPVLTVGGADVVITVSAAPPQLETSNAALGSTMENEQFSELPSRWALTALQTSGAPLTSSTSCRRAGK